MTLNTNIYTQLMLPGVVGVNFQMYFRTALGQAED